MSRMRYSLATTLLSGLALAGCASGAKQPANINLETTPLDLNEITVESMTEMLEIELDPAYPTLKREDVRAVERFVSTYVDRGHGNLIMAVPENAPNRQLAVEAIKVARQIAWERGVSYEAMEGRVFDAAGVNAPIVLAFEAFETTGPNCRSLAAYDLSDISSNNEPSSFGCAVRNNIAAMLADPGDLLGQRTLGPSENERTASVIDAYQTGGGGGGGEDE